MNQPLDTSLLDRAIIYAVQSHAGTERRGKGFPYIVHPAEAMAIAATMTADQEILAAAVLHDVVEDTDVTLDELRKEFGDRIAGLVESESDQASDNPDPEASWHERKQAGIDRLRAASRDAKIVALGDKLSNMRAIARDYATEGEAFWQLFHVKDKNAHGTRYHALVRALSDLKGTFAFEEFERLVNQVFPESCKPYVPNQNPQRPGPRRTAGRRREDDPPRPPAENGPSQRSHR